MIFFFGWRRSITRRRPDDGSLERIVRSSLNGRERVYRQQIRRDGNRAEWVAVEGDAQSQSPPPPPPGWFRSAMGVVAYGSMAVVFGTTALVEMGHQWQQRRTQGWTARAGRITAVQVTQRKAAADDVMPPERALTRLLAALHRDQTAPGTLALDPAVETELVSRAHDAAIAPQDQQQQQGRHRVFYDARVTYAYGDDLDSPHEWLADHDGDGRRNQYGDLVDDDKSGGSGDDASLDGSQQHIGTMLWHGVRSTNCLGWSEEDARYIADKLFPVGAPAAVYVNPNNNSQAVLLRGPPQSHMIESVLHTFTMLVALYFLRRAAISVRDLRRCYRGLTL